MNGKRYILSLVSLILLFCCGTKQARAQVSIANGDTTICSGSSVVLNASYAGRTANLVSLADDRFSSVINLPFSFTFYGTSYNKCIISSNGYISFDISKANLSCDYLVYGPLPNSSNPDLQKVIMAGFADLFPNNAGDIDWAVVGSAPNRKFIVTWCNMPFFQCRSQFVAMQAVLYEGTNVIDLQLSKKENCNSGTYGNVSGYTIQGLQKDFTTAHTVPGRNATFWGASQDGYRFTPNGSNSYTGTVVPYNFTSRAAWYVNGNTFLSGNSSITVTPATTASYIYKTDCADVYADTVTVTVNPTPAIRFGSVINPASCTSNNGSISISGLTPNTTYTISYIYNANNNVSITGAANALGSFTLSGLATGSYTNISATFINCPSNTLGPILLTAPGTPATPSATASPNPVCTGNTLSLATTGQAGFTYTWSGPNGFTATGSTASVPNISTNAAGIYALIATNNTTLCASAAGAATVSVNATPATPVINAPASLCSGETIFLSTPQVAGGSYSWRGPNGFTSVVQNPTMANVPVAASGIYQLMVTVAGCTSATANSVVSVNPVPVIASVTGIQPTTCSGNDGSIELGGLVPNTSYATNYTKNGITQPLLFITTNGAGILRIIGLNAGNYNSFVVSDLNCISQPATAAIALTDPPLPVITIAAQSNVRCFGEANGSVTINASGAAPYSYVWSSSGLGNTANGLSAGNYTVTVTDAHLCRQSKTIAITQPTGPLAVAVAAVSPLCEGTALNLLGTTSGGTLPYTYQWTGPNTFSATTATARINSVITTNAGTYNLTVTDANGCATNSGTNVVVNALPASPGIISGDANVCAGTVNTYRVAPVPGAVSYNWVVPANPAAWIATSAPGLDSLRLTAPATSGAGVISVTAVNGCGASAVSSIPLTVTRVPATPVSVSGDALVCGGISATYSTASVPEATVYNWTVPANWPTPAGTGNSITLTAPSVVGNGLITVSAANFCGTSATASRQVTVTNSIPAQPVAITGAGLVCSGAAQTYKIEAVPNAANYSWVVTGNGWTRSASNPTDTFINTLAGTATATISVTTGNSCGVSVPQILNVAVAKIPDAAGSIAGPDSLCIGSGQLSLTTSQINEATTYTWTLPAGWSGGSTTNLLSPVPQTGAATGAVIFKVAGTNMCGTGIASQKTIIVNHTFIPSVTVAASARLICAGNSITYTATVTNGGAAPIYLWKVNGIASITGNGNPTFTTNTLSDGDVVTVTVHSSLPCTIPADGWVSATAHNVPVTQNLMPGININATTTPDICKGAPVTFYSNINGGGAGPSYRWFKNDVLIPNATGANYTDSTLNNGDTIRVLLKSNARCRLVDTITSNKMGMSVSAFVNPVISISVHPGTVIASGQTVTFTASIANTGPNPEVRWKRNGLTVAGTTGVTWTTNTCRDGDRINAELVSGARCATVAIVSSADTLKMKIGTGIGSATFGNSTIGIYPNPTSGKFTIAVQSPGSVPGREVSLDILNAIGQVVYHSLVRPDTQDWSVDVQLDPQMSNGIYLLKVGAYTAEDTIANDAPGMLRFELIR